MSRKKISKKIIFLIICSFCLCSFDAFSNDSVNANKTDKVYVSLDKVYMNEDGIFVHLNGEYLQISNLCHDSSGYFYGFKQNNLEGGWTCPKCHYENSSSAEYCERCWWPLYED